MSSEYKHAENNHPPAFALVTQLPSIAWIQDSAGRLVFVNEAHKKLMGTSEESLGKSVFDLFPADIAAEYRKNDETVLESKEVISTIEKAMDANGSVATYKVTKFPLLIEGEWMVGGLVTDISDREAQHNHLLQHERSKAKLTVTSIIEAQEAERQHLSQLLRDGINQTLTSCKLMMEVGGHEINPYLLHSYTQIQSAIKELGKISANLSGSVIHEIGLLPAIDHLLANERSGLQLETDLQDADILCLSDKLQLGLYRIMQSVTQLVSDYPIRENATVRLLIQNKNVYVLMEIWEKKDWVKLSKNQDFRNINNQAEYLDGVVSFDNGDLLITLPVRN